jgi:hypothetical protein
MAKTLQRKLRAWQSGSAGSGDFILADAKDADLAPGGLPEPVARSQERPDATFPYRSREAFFDQIVELIEASPLDLMVLSPPAASELTGPRGPFHASNVSPSVRMLPGLGLATGLTLDDAGPIPIFGVGHCADRSPGAAELNAYEQFRREAGAARRRHILELYPACGCDGGPPRRTGEILSDRLIHSILEVPPAARPLLVQTPYYGPRLMEGMAACLPGVSVGVLGGPASTAFDAFQLLDESRRHGARAALFGRRIAAAEHQAAFVRLLDHVARGEASPAEAVHAYHGVLQGLRIRPLRELSEDLQPGARLFRGEETSATCVVVPELPYGGERSAAIANPKPAPAVARTAYDDEPDFDRMTPQEKLEYNQRRRDRIFG